MVGILKQISRKISTSRAIFSSMKEPLPPVQHEKHTEASVLLWKRVFFFVCCPAIAVASLNVALTEEPPRPEFKKYPYLRIRTSKFPWRDGVKTLFHNPHTNALPDGYENVEDHH